MKRAPLMLGFLLGCSAAPAVQPVRTAAPAGAAVTVAAAGTATTAPSASPSVDVVSHASQPVRPHHEPIALDPPPEPNPCPPEMAYLPAGHYPFGDPPKDTPVVQLCMDKTEGTVASYRECAKHGACTAPYALKHPDRWMAVICDHTLPDHEDYPINCITLEQATEFCAFEKKRLPSSSEWEWAARDGDMAKPFPWGDSVPDGTQANMCGAECVKGLHDVVPDPRFVAGEQFAYLLDDGFVAPARPGSFPAGRNRWGVEDLVGNVWEWASTKEGPGTLVGGDFFTFLQVTQASALVHRA